MRLTKGTSQRLFRLGHSNKVDMVRHQTPGKNIYTVAFTLISNKGKVGNSIIIGGEDSHRTDTALSQVVWVSRHNKTWKASHGYSIGTERSLAASDQSAISSSS